MTVVTRQCQRVAPEGAEAKGAWSPRTKSLPCELARLPALSNPGEADGQLRSQAELAVVVVEQLAVERAETRAASAQRLSGVIDACTEAWTVSTQDHASLTRYSPSLLCSVFRLMPSTWAA